MRLALICPTFPPQACGVGDHSSRLADALADAGAEPVVWSAAPGAGRLIPRPWDATALRRLNDELCAFRPDAVFVQYTPHLFAPERRGVQPGLVPWLGELRRRAGVPVALCAHELNYPGGLSPRGLGLGLPQLLQFLGLAAQADHVFFTYRAALERTARRLPWRDPAAFSCLPVGSNILPPGAPPAPGLRVELLRRLGRASAASRILLHFGGMHPTHLLEPMLEALAGQGDARLVFVGAEPDALARRLNGTIFEALLPRVHGLGYLEPPQVSEWLEGCDAVLSPFMDGVSTRRGSFMAALAHARPVVTTRGWATDGQIPWESFCEITDRAHEFSQAVGRVLLCPSAAMARAEAGRRYYEESFSWPRIAGAVIQTIAAMTSSRRQTPLAA